MSTEPILDSGTMQRPAGNRWLHERFERWMRRRNPPAQREIVVHRRRLYILPTAFGLYYALMLLVMLLMALNYNNSMVFAFTFLLAGLGVNAMWFTHRNLLDLRVECIGAGPVHAGEMARFGFRVHNPSHRPRIALALEDRLGAVANFSLPGDGDTRVILDIHAPRRGWRVPGRLVLQTRYPFGLFRAWAWLEFDSSALVYPAPLRPCPPLQPAPDGTRGASRQAGAGSDDYAGLRDYRAGDSPRHIAWKSLARHDHLLTKVFSGAASGTVWLAWDPAWSVDVETGVSTLCAQVLHAAREGLHYGLQLPGQTLPPAAGAGHRSRCLKALALYGNPAR